MDILSISFSWMNTDSRVKRQLNILEQLGKVTLCCHDSGDLNVDAVEVDRITFNYPGKIIAPLQLLTGRYLNYYFSLHYIQQAMKKLKGRRFDLIVANDLNALPLAFELPKKRGGKILFDAHEFSPLEFEDRMIWRIFFGRYAKWLSKTFAPRANAMTTVSRGVANAWKNLCGVHPVIITNAPPRYDLQPKSIKTGHIRMIHHGGATRSRKLETMIELMHQLDRRFTLDLVLVPGDSKYIEELRSKAMPLCNRIQFLPPVPSQEVPVMCNKYDLGLYLMPPTSLNNQLALPNKFFEFIQGRIGVANYPIKEITEHIHKYSCGVVSDTFSVTSMAKCLNALSENDVQNFKRNAHQAAEVLCYEDNFSRWDEVFQQLGITACVA